MDIDGPISGSITLNTNYRRYGNARNKEFNYFVTRILPAINPTFSDFRRQKGTKLLSEMFTITDEAFGLIMLYNEYNVWDMQQQFKEGLVDEASAKIVKKRFIDAKSGKREGWVGGGRTLFNMLCKKIQQLRLDPVTGSEFEILIREHFRSENGHNHDTSETQEETVFEEDFLDSEFNELLQAAI